MKAINHFIACVAIVLCTSCIRTTVTLTPVEVSNITANSAKAKWHVVINPGKEGIPEDMKFYLLYTPLSIAPTNALGWRKIEVETPNTATYEFRSKLDGLQPMSGYHVAAYCTWGNKQIISRAVYFKTGQALQAVDLGLPSGIKWATENILDSFGKSGYFAWGETSEKSYYEWGTYKFGSYDDFRKYCTDSSNGHNGDFDNKLILDFCDDAAHKKFGDSWRIPTMTDWKELAEYCEWVWTKQDSQNGMKVTGPNGQSIFLPADGQKDYNERFHYGQIGFYWSSNLYQTNPYLAWCLVFDSSGLSYTNDFWYGWRWDFSNTGRRCLGRSIRPVQDPIDI